MFFKLKENPFLYLFKKKQLFCGAPHELINRTNFYVFLGFKWPLKNGPVPFQETIEVFKCFIAINAIFRYA